MGYALFFISILAVIIMIPFSEAAARGASEGTRLFALTVLPSLFPFMVCANCISESRGAAFSGRIKPSVRIVLTDVLAAICGSPSAVILIGSDFANGLYGVNEASALCAAFNQAGPAFVLSAFAVGMLARPDLRIALAAAHYTPPLLFSVIYAVVIRKKSPAPLSPGKESIRPLGVFASSTAKSVTEVLKIGGTIVFSRSLFAVAEAAPVINGLTVFFRGVSFGAAEMTNGLSILAAEPTRAGIAASSFLLSFGGAAVFIQSKMLFPKLKAWVYFAVKTAMGAISALVIWTVFPMFDASAEAFGSLSESVKGLSPVLGARTAGFTAAIVCAAASLIVSALYAKLIAGKNK